MSTVRMVSKENSYRELFKTESDLSVLRDIYFNLYKKRIISFGIGSPKLQTLLSACLEEQFHNNFSQIRKTFRNNVIANDVISSIKTVFLNSLLPMSDEQAEQILLDKINKSQRNRCLISLIKELTDMRNGVIIFLDENTTINSSEKIVIENKWVNFINVARAKVSYSEKIGDVLSKNNGRMQRQAILISLLILNYYTGFLSYIYSLMFNIKLTNKKSALYELFIQLSLVKLAFLFFLTIIFALKKANIFFVSEEVNLKEVTQNSCREYAKKFPEITFIFPVYNKDNHATNLLTEVKEVEDISTLPKTKVKTVKEAKTEESKEEKKPEQSTTPLFFQPSPCETYTEIKESALKGFCGNLFLHIDENNSRHARVLGDSAKDVRELAGNERTSVLYPAGHSGKGFNMRAATERDLNNCLFKSKLGGVRIGFAVRPLNVMDNIQVEDLKGDNYVASPRARAGK